MRTLIHLALLTIVYVGYAKDNHTFIKGVAVEGETFLVVNKKITILDNQVMLFVLKEPPLGSHYQCELPGVECSLTFDSSHILIPALKRGSHTLSINLVQNGSILRAEELNISVNNSFLKSKWYIITQFGYIVFLLMLVIFLINLFTARNKEKVQELRNDWTNQLHNDIGGDLSGVEKRLEILKKKLSGLDEKTHNNLNNIFLILAEIQKKLRFVFNLVDPKKDSLDVIIEEISAYISDNAYIQGIRFVFSNKLSAGHDFKIDASRINKLYLVMKEACNNVFKHAKASMVELSVNRVKEGIEIRIIDNGIGFDPGQKFKGNGISNLLDYARTGFLDVGIQSQVGKGTQINILLYLV